MAAYNLPRFMSREEWDSLSTDNLCWLKQAGKWVKFPPDTIAKDCAIINFGHPENELKRSQESAYTYGKRIHEDYRKMYGV